MDDVMGFFAERWCIRAQLRVYSVGVFEGRIEFRQDNVPLDTLTSDLAHASVQRRDQPTCSIAAERECQAVPLRQFISRKQSGLLTGAFLHAHCEQG